MPILMDRHDAGPEGIHKRQLLCRADNAHRQIPSYDTIRSELIQAGFQVNREYEFRYPRNWSNPEPDSLRFGLMLRGIQMSTAGVAGFGTNVGSLGEIPDEVRRWFEGRTVFGIFRKFTAWAVVKTVVHHYVVETISYNENLT
jgi:hypothetical protein